MDSFELGEDQGWRRVAVDSSMARRGPLFLTAYDGPEASVSLVSRQHQQPQHLLRVDQQQQQQQRPSHSTTGFSTKISPQNVGRPGRGQPRDRATIRGQQSRRSARHNPWCKNFSLPFSNADQEIRAANMRARWATASRIQRVFRHYRQRKRKAQQLDAAVNIQRVFRGYRTRFLGLKHGVCRTTLRHFLGGPLPLQSWVTKQQARVRLAVRLKAWHGRQYRQRKSLTDKMKAEHYHGILLGILRSFHFQDLRLQHQRNGRSASPSSKLGCESAVANSPINESSLTGPGTASSMAVPIEVNAVSSRRAHLAAKTLRRAREADDYFARARTLGAVQRIRTNFVTHGMPVPKLEAQADSGSRPISGSRSHDSLTQSDEQARATRLLQSEPVCKFTRHLFQLSCPPHATRVDQDSYVRISFQMQHALQPDRRSTFEEHRALAIAEFRAVLADWNGRGKALSKASAHEAAEAVDVRRDNGVVDESNTQPTSPQLPRGSKFASRINDVRIEESSVAAGLLTSAEPAANVGVAVRSAAKGPAAPKSASKKRRKNPADVDRHYVMGSSKAATAAAAKAAANDPLITIGYDLFHRIMCQLASIWVGLPDPTFNDVQPHRLFFFRILNEITRKEHHPEGVLMLFASLDRVRCLVDIDGNITDECLLDGIPEEETAAEWTARMRPRVLPQSDVIEISDGASSTQNEGDDGADHVGSDIAASPKAPERENGDEVEEAPASHLTNPASAGSMLAVASKDIILGKGTARGGIRCKLLPAVPRSIKGSAPLPQSRFRVPDFATLQRVQHEAAQAVVDGREIDPAAFVNDSDEYGDWAQVEQMIAQNRKDLRGGGQGLFGGGDPSFWGGDSLSLSLTLGTRAPRGTERLFQNHGGGNDADGDHTIDGSVIETKDTGREHGQGETRHNNDGTGAAKRAGRRQRSSKPMPIRLLRVPGLRTSLPLGPQPQVSPMVRVDATVSQTLNRSSRQQNADATPLQRYSQRPAPLRRLTAAQKAAAKSSSARASNSDRGVFGTTKNALSNSRSVAKLPVLFSMPSEEPTVLGEVPRARRGRVKSAARGTHHGGGMWPQQRRFREENAGGRHSETRAPPHDDAGSQRKRLVQRPRPAQTDKNEKSIFDRLSAPGSKVDEERSRFWNNLRRRSQYGAEFVARQTQLNINSNGMRKIYDPRMLVEVTDTNPF